MLVRFKKINDDRAIRLIVEMDYEKEIEKNNIMEMLKKKLGKICSYYGNNKIIFTKYIYELNNEEEINNFYSESINTIVSALYEIYRILQKIEDVNLVFEF